MEYKDADFAGSIIQAINNNKLVLFIGAGFSKLCGLPLWTELAAKLMDSCVEEGLMDYSDRHQIVQGKDSKSLITIAYHLFKRENKLDKFYQIFDYYLSYQNFSTESNSAKKKKLVDLIKRSHATVLTTNSDDILHECFADDLIYYSEDKLKSYKITDNRHLLHLHGFKGDKKSLVFTTEQYLTRYASQRFRNSIKGIFQSDSTILFIGYGLSELQFLDFLVNINDPMSKRYVLEGFFDYEKADIMAKEIYYKTFQLDLVTYSKNEKGYEGLIDALEYLIEETEKLSSGRSQNYNSSVYLIDQAPKKSSLISLDNNLIAMSETEQDSLISYVAQSRFASDWIVGIYELEIGYSSIFSIRKKLKPGLKVKNGFQGVDFTGLRCLADIFEHDKKNKKLYRIIKKILLETFDAFEKNIDLYSNFFIVGVIQRLIFSDYRLMNNEQSYQFIVQSENSNVNLSRDWITWIYYESDELLLCNKKMAFKYIESVINSSQNEGNNNYEFGSFVKKFGIRISEKYPKEIFRLLLSLVKEKASSQYWYFIESNGSLILFNNSNPENFHSADEIIVYWFTISLNFFNQNDLIKIFKLWSKSKITFFNRLSIYLINQHFDLLKDEFFSSIDNLLNKWEIYSDMYLFIKNHTENFTKKEIECLVNWIKIINFKEISLLYNQKNKLDLLNLLSNQNFKNKEILENIEQIHSNFSSEEKMHLSDFTAPEFRNRRIWISSYIVKDDEDFSKRLSECNVEEFVDLISGDLTESQAHSVFSKFEQFAKKVGLVEWLNAESFNNIDRLNKKYYFNLIDLIFRHDPFLQFDLVENSYRTLISRLDNKEAQEFLSRSMSELYYSYLKMLKESDAPTYKSIIDFVFRELRGREFNWQNINSYPQKVSYHTLVGVDVYHPIGLLIRASYSLNKDCVTSYLSGSLSDCDKQPILKGIILAHIGYLWELNEAWVKNNIVNLLNNSYEGHNLSIIGFILSQYYRLDFVRLLDQNVLLEQLLNSDDFSEIGNVFIYNFLVEYGGDEQNEDLVRKFLSSKYALGALHMYADSIKKLEKIELLEDKINNVFRIASETNFSYKDESGYAIIRLLKVFDSFSIKEYIWKLIIRLLDRHNIYNIKEVIECLLNSRDITNEMKMEFVEKYISKLNEHYLFRDEIVKLINVPDWSGFDNRRQEIINKLGKINPDFFRICNQQK